MEQFLFHEYAPDQRAEYLKDNCIAVEEMGYTRRFTNEELAQMKSSLSDISIEHNDEEEEKKELLADINARIKGLVTARKAILKKLKNKAEYVKEPCFKFSDETSRTVGYYNSEGELIFSRPMNPEEMQLRIPRIAKAQ